MPISEVRLLAGGALVALAAAASIAQERPESILPPGFGQPEQPTPSPSASPRALATSGATAQPIPREKAGETPSDLPSAEPTPKPTVDAATLAEYELPEASRRSLAVVGVDDTGFDADAWGSADGRSLETWMRAFKGPLASRWLEITLRRALLAAADTPRSVNGADFAAERAWLLLRLGEPVAARALVQGVDPDHYTPKLYQVAMQAALATGDPAATCPLVDGANARAPDPAWRLAKPICVSLGGAPAAATQLLAADRRARVARGIDFQLAQKVVGVGGQGRQAVTIEWDGVDRLTAWRWGLAAATGVEVPDTLYATAGPQLAGWRALSPAIPVAKRLAPAETAAAMGVLSNVALVDLYSSGEEDSGEDAAASAAASDLREAYTGATFDARRTAMERLWGATDANARVPYGRLVLTARGAARLRPVDKLSDADRLVASMLSAGLDRTAERWRDHVAEGSDAWAMLLLADPDAEGTVAYRTLGAYSGTGDAATKQRLFFAGLAGLGRLSPDDIERGARALDVRIGLENSWTRALDRAARDREPGTVVLLTAIGMQTPAWRGVPPEALYRIVGALRAVGLDGIARMVAAEAIARA